MVIINLLGQSVTPGGAHMRRHPRPHVQHFWAETCINHKLKVYCLKIMFASHRKRIDIFNENEKLGNSFLY